LISQYKHVINDIASKNKGGVKIMNNETLEATITQLWKDALALQRVPETQFNASQTRDVIVARNALNNILERIEKL
jgi:hypothetical protein